MFCFVSQTFNYILEIATLQGLNWEFETAGANH